MRVGIVVVSWNVRELLAECLESVFAEIAREGLDARVVVVDNASSDGSPDLVRERFPRAELLVNDGNPGFGAANNQALHALGFSVPIQAPTPPPSPLQPPSSVLGPRLSVVVGPSPAVLGSPSSVVFLNPDTVVQPGALAALTGFLRDHRRAGAAGAKLLNPDGSLQHSAFRFPGVVQAWLDLFPPRGRWQRLLDSPLNGRYPAATYARGEPFRVDFPLGAAFAVRGEVVAQTGGFDEHYHLYCEEIDWHWRIARAGWERWCVPVARVIHHGGRSTGQMRLEAFRELWQSRRRLYGQYRSPLTVAVVAWMVRRAVERRSRRAAPEMRRALAQVAEAWSR